MVNLVTSVLDVPLCGNKVVVQKTDSSAFRNLIHGRRLNRIMMTSLSTTTMIMLMVTMITLTNNVIPFCQVRQVHRLVQVAQVNLAGLQQTLRDCCCQTSARNGHLCRLSDPDTNDVKQTKYNRLR